MEVSDAVFDCADRREQVERMRVNFVWVVYLFFGLSLPFPCWNLGDFRSCWIAIPLRYYFMVLLLLSLDKKIKMDVLMPRCVVEGLGVRDRWKAVYFHNAMEIWLSVLSRWLLNLYHSNLSITAVDDGREGSTRKEKLERLETQKQILSSEIWVLSSKF